MRVSYQFSGILQSVRWESFNFQKTKKSIQRKINAHIMKLYFLDIENFAKIIIEQFPHEELIINLLCPQTSLRH